MSRPTRWFRSDLSQNRERSYINGEHFSWAILSMVGPMLIMIFMPEASGITCLVHHESQHTPSVLKLPCLQKR